MPPTISATMTATQVAIAHELDGALQTKLNVDSSA